MYAAPQNVETLTSSASKASNDTGYPPPPCAPSVSALREDPVTAVDARLFAICISSPFAGLGVLGVLGVLCCVMRRASPCRVVLCRVVSCRVVWLAGNQASASGQERRVHAERGGWGDPAGPGEEGASHRQAHRSALCEDGTERARGGGGETARGEEEQEFEGKGTHKRDAYKRQKKIETFRREKNKGREADR